MPKINLHEYRGELLTTNQLSKIFNMPANTLRTRLRKGWNPNSIKVNIKLPHRINEAISGEDYAKLKSSFIGDCAEDGICW